jgi:stage V sporulation protein SpoVS
MSGTMLTFDGAVAMSKHLIDLDEHTAWLVQQLVSNGPTSAEAATALTIEKLRRLEDLARNSGADRQAFQKILSARRMLGDHADLGRIPAFDDVSINPSPEALRVPLAPGSGSTA